ncbi:response regulator [Desulfosoma sp.]
MANCTKDGSGLGLPTAYSIVKRHDGHITVRSTPGKGTEMVFYLLASKADGAEPAAEDMDGPLACSGRPLLMDDDPIVREVLSAMLEQLGFETEEAHEGMEALSRYEKALAAGRPFAAVILDLTVPGGVGGREIIQKIRALDPSVRAIASSGYANDPVMAQPHAFGFSGVMAKPYRMEDLEKVLRAVLRNRLERDRKPHGKP